MGAVEFSSNAVNALAWPLAVILLAFSFRSQITAWMQTILAKRTGSVTAGMVKAEWNDESATALGAAGQQLVEPGAEEQVAAAEEARRKDNVEAIIEAAARWGWDQCRAGIFKGFPTPMVEWDDNDRPYILAGVVLNPGDTLTTGRVYGKRRTRTILPRTGVGPLDPPTP